VIGGAPAQRYSQIPMERVTPQSARVAPSSRPTPSGEPPRRSVSAGDPRSAVTAGRRAGGRAGGGLSVYSKGGEGKRRALLPRKAVPSKKRQGLGTARGEERCGGHTRATA